MPWVRFDDQYLLNRKIRSAGRDSPHAVLVHWGSVVFAARNLTDGLIQHDDLEDLAHEVMLTIPQTRKAIGVLVAAGLFVESPMGWQIKDYAEYQPTRSQVLDKREQDRERQAQSRMSRRVSQRDTTCDTTRESQGSSVVSPRVPTRPDPIGVSTHNGSSSVPVDNSVGGGADLEAIGRVLDVLVDQQASKGNPRNPAAYRKTIAERVRSEHTAEIERLVAEFPTAPAAMVAARVLGQPTPYLAQHRRNPEWSHQ